ncbi:hypothetical protein B7486_59610, partial [cyanobacterium TDX16]
MALGTENLGVAQSVTGQLHDPTIGTHGTGPLPEQAPVPPPVEEAPPPVLSLPHVPLTPPPTEAKELGSGAARAVMTSLGLVCGSIVVAAAFLAGIAYLGVVTGRLVFIGIALVLAIPFVRALAILFKPRRIPAEAHMAGWTLAPGEEPKLEAFVAQVAQQVGTRPPDEITLHVHVTA